MDSAGDPIMRDIIVATEVTGSVKGWGGRSVDRVAYCSKHEESGNRKMKEHDILATAHTRAKNGSISDFVGGGIPSAEEVNTGSANSPSKAKEWNGNKGNAQVSNPDVEPTEKQKKKFLELIESARKKEIVTDDKAHKAVEWVDSEATKGTISE